MNPLPQLIPQRVAGVHRQVAARGWESVEPLVVLGGPVNATVLSVEEAARQELRPVQPGEHFGPPYGGWQQRWFRVDVPAARPGEQGRRRLGWACGGETTAWLDGVPWAGLDVFHPDCPLQDDAVTLWLECALWGTEIVIPPRTTIGPYGVRFDGCDLRVRDELAWSVALDLDVLTQLLGLLLRDESITLPRSAGHLQPLEHCSPLLRLLLRGLDDACDAWVTDGLPGLQAALVRLFARLPAEVWQPAASLIGHAHIDLVWLWPERATERKALHSFATVLRLMERYPELTFSGSQPALYRMVERQAPTLQPQIATRVAEGRWDIHGGFEVEPDTNLPCGEALARSLVYGQRKIAALRGAQSDVCWLPDVFGYSAALPQILRLGGVTRFFTTKIAWSSITRFPYSSFVWRGHDGSEVLAHLCPVNYNGEVELADINSALRAHRQADVHPEMLLPTGYGDGGGGPTEEMCERARRIADLAGAPRASWTTAGAFFDRLDAVRERLPVYQGELYLEYHRGTYTTQAEHKRFYRAAESALQAHEAVRVVNGGGPLGEDAWLRVLFAQFHDALPGSSIGLVYEELNAELAQIAARELDAAVAELASDDDADELVAFNPLPVPRSAIVDSPDGPQLVHLPALGGARVTTGIAHNPVMRASPTLLDNGTIQARFDEHGRLCGLISYGTDLALAAPCEFVLYHDEPANFDAWDIDHYSANTGSAVGTMQLQVVESNRLRAVLRGMVRLGEVSSLSVDYTLEAESSHLRIDARVDWSERHRLLAFRVPTGYAGPFARYGCPFGAIQRSQQPGREADEAMWEVPGSRWAAVTHDDATGIALLAEAKYGFACRDGELRVSLLRAPTSPDAEADQGSHHIRFAIGEHQERHTSLRPNTAAAADALFAPVLVARAADAPQPPFVLDDLGSLTPCWVLPAATVPGYIIRLHETGGSAGVALLRLASPPHSVRLVDFFEQEIGPLVADVDGDIALEYGPYQVVSVLVQTE